MNIIPGIFIYTTCGRLSFVMKTWLECKNEHWLHHLAPRTIFVRAEKADLYHPSTEPQEYELVEFFIKRIKLWLGLTKAKEVGRNIYEWKIHEEHMCVDVSLHFLSLAVQT